MLHPYTHLGHPAFPFVSSVGAIVFQASSFVLLGLLSAPFPKSLKFAWIPLYILWYFIPLVSLAGIWSAIKRLKSKEGVFLSGLGLLLNVGYFAFFLLITISAAKSDNAWNF